MYGTYLGKLLENVFSLDLGKEFIRFWNRVRGVGHIGMLFLSGVTLLYAK